MRWTLRAAAILALLLIGPLMMVSCGNIKLGQNWRTADRSSTGVAPSPDQAREAVILVYAARAFNWRGIFAVHTWIATKPRDASHYTVHQVVGWRRYSGLPVLVSAPDYPDRSWYGATPEALRDIRGAEAERIIPLVEAAVARYPYAGKYVLFPGPNSNTFTAFVAREVPDLRLDLPPTAIGKDYLPGGLPFGRAPSGTGFQVSLLGLLGVTAALEEGIEVNLFGVAIGVDPLALGLRLPGVGNVGLLSR